MSASDEIRSRLADRIAAVTSGLREERTISTMRIAVFAVFIAFLWIAFVMKAIAGWWSLLPLLIFVVLIVRHDGLVRRRDESERAVHFYETSLAHLENRWSGSGETGQEYAEGLHPYAATWISSAGGRCLNGFPSPDPEPAMTGGRVAPSSGLA